MACSLNTENVSSLHASTSKLIAGVAALGVSLEDGSKAADHVNVYRQLEDFWTKQRSIEDRHKDLNCTVAVLAQAKSGVPPQHTSIS